MKGFDEARPPFKIRTTPEDIAPFFFVNHHPYALALLLKIKDGFARRHAGVGAQF